MCLKNNNAKKNCGFPHTEAFYWNVFSRKHSFQKTCGLLHLFLSQRVIIWAFKQYWAQKPTRFASYLTQLFSSSWFDKRQSKILYKCNKQNFNSFLHRTASFYTVSHPARNYKQKRHKLILIYRQKHTSQVILTTYIKITFTPSVFRLFLAQLKYSAVLWG